MYVAEWTQEGGWQGQMLPYGPLHLDPAAQARMMCYGRCTASSQTPQ